MRRAWAVGIVVLGMLVLAPSASAFIYWADFKNGRIGRAANDGSGVEPNFITGAGSPVGVAIDANHIYWPNYSAQAVGRANIDGTAVDKEFIVEVDSPRAVAVNGSSIFWASGMLGAIGRANLGGTDIVPKLVSGIDEPCGIALDSGHIYWSGSEFVGRSSLGGGFKEPEFVKPGGVLCGVAVNSASIYWATFNTGFIFPGVTIGRAKVTDASEVDKSIIGDADGPCGVAIFGQQLYWANSETNTIGRADIAGSGASAVNQSYIATQGAGICGVAVDGLSSPPPPQPAPSQPAADNRPPVAKISKGPGKKLVQGIARFAFSSDESGSTFRCKLDSRKPAKCRSPKTYKHLKPGRHTFKVWATDAAGNQSKPAKRSFRVPS